MAEATKVTVSISVVTIIAILGAYGTGVTAVNQTETNAVTAAKLEAKVEKVEATAAKNRRAADSHDIMLKNMMALLQGIENRQIANMNSIQRDIRDLRTEIKEIK